MTGLACANFQNLFFSLPFSFLSNWIKISLAGSRKVNLNNNFWFALSFWLNFVSGQLNLTQLGGLDGKKKSIVYLNYLVASKSKSKSESKSSCCWLVWLRYQHQPRLEELGKPLAALVDPSCSIHELALLSVTLLLSFHHPVLFYSITCAKIIVSN